jgi:hypothetical protein
MKTEAQGEDDDHADYEIPIGRVRGSNDHYFGDIRHFAFYFPADEFEEKTADPPYHSISPARQFLAQYYIANIPPR